MFALDLQNVLCLDTDCSLQIKDADDIFLMTQVKSREKMQ